jgi:nucleoside-diphosphate-sugar epimerase
MNTVNIRPFSVYGEGESMHRFIPTVIDSIVNQKELDLYPDPVHDWIYIEDFIEGVLVVADNVAKLNGKAVNIGSGKQYTNKHVYEMLCDIARKRPLETHKKNLNRPNDTNVMWQADNTVLRKLGWQAKYTLKEGLAKTYDYYCDILNISQDDDIDLDRIVDKTIELAGGKWEDIPSAR